MAFEIKREDQEGVVVLAVSGKLTVGEANSTLRESVTKLAEGGEKMIVLDLGEVDYIDSSGLGALVICYTVVEKAGGKLKLLNLTKRNIELLVLTKLETVFETFDNRQDAINSFFANRDVKRFDILSFVQRMKEEKNK